MTLPNRRRPKEPDVPNADGPAGRAWAMMLRDDNPMPPEAALDWLREESGVEDVAVLKMALFAFAGMRMGQVGHDEDCHTWPEGEPEFGVISGTLTGKGCWRLAEGKLDNAIKQVDWILKRHRESPTATESPFVVFASEFQRVWEMCKAIEGLPQ